MFTVTSELEGNQVMVPRATHMNEDVRGSDLVPAKTGEVNGVDCAEVIMNPVLVCVENGGQPPTE